MELQLFELREDDERAFQRRRRLHRGALARYSHGVCRSLVVYGDGRQGSLFFFAPDGFWCFFSCVTFLSCATLRGSDMAPREDVLRDLRQNGYTVRLGKDAALLPSIRPRMGEGNEHPVLRKDELGQAHRKLAVSRCRVLRESPISPVPSPSGE